MPDIISNMEITLWPIYELVDLGKTFVLVYMELPHVSVLIWNDCKVKSRQTYNSTSVVSGDKNANDAMNNIALRIVHYSLVPCCKRCGDACCKLQSVVSSLSRSTTSM